MTAIKSRRTSSCRALIALGGMLIACSSRSGAADSVAPKPAEPEPDFRLTASIAELMDAEIDPAADFLWDSVATISRLDGVEERQPRSDEEWQEVRRHALTLLEATNLLAMSGRRVTHAYKPASDPSELDSLEAQAKLDANHALFVALAHGLHDAGSQVLRAIDAKDPEALFEIGSVLDNACEACHMVFWYPKQAAQVP